MGLKKEYVKKMSNMDVEKNLVLLKMQQEKEREEKKIILKALGVLR